MRREGGVYPFRTTPSFRRQRTWNSESNIFFRGWRVNDNQPLRDAKIQRPEQKQLRCYQPLNRLGAASASSSTVREGSACARSVTIPSINHCSWDTKNCIIFPQTTQWSCCRCRNRHFVYGQFSPSEASQEGGVRKMRVLRA